MKITKCYNCDSDKNSLYAEEHGYKLVKCDFCGLLFVENQPDEFEISKMHEHGENLGDKKLNVTGTYHPSYIPRYLKILDDLFKGDLENKNSWLDVGCGHGEFISAIQKYFHQDLAVKGIEPNERKRESARKRGLNVTYFNIETHEEKYDVISLLNVYSHLPDPPGFLNTLKSLLNPGGELIIQTGDTADLAAKDHLRPYNLPNHLSFASESIVKGILERLDFKILTIKKYPGLKSDIMSFLREFAKIFTPGYRSRIHYYTKLKIYSQSDMFIRSKLNSE